MKIKSLLAAFVLAMTVLCAGAATVAPASPAAPSCASVCFNNYNACKASCNGDPLCLSDCEDDFDCCRIICHGFDCP